MIFESFSILKNNIQNTDRVNEVFDGVKAEDFSEVVRKYKLSNEILFYESAKSFFQTSDIDTRLQNTLQCRRHTTG